MAARFEGAREAELGVAAARGGDLERAGKHLARAIKAQPRNPEHHYNLGIVRRNAGEIDAAAACLTRALRCKPGHEQAARRLAGLLARYALAEPEGLDRYGLKAALAAPGIDRQPVVDAAIEHLKQAGGLGELLERGAREGWREAARKLLAGGGGLLKDELLLLALAEGVNRDPGLERLLTAARALVLRETEDGRFADKAFRAFVCALIRQCLNNEWVFHAAPEERRAVGAVSLDREAFLAGDNAAARAFMRRALYMPLEEALEGLPAPEACGRIRPSALRELVASYAAMRAREAELARSLPAVGALADETSRRVAGQYEENPYPRWTSLQRPEDGAARRTLARFFDAGHLGFLDRPFTVLVAGAGTGKQALSSALAYGGNASVLAIDLSASSLAHAMRMAEALGVDNVDFLQADILQLESGESGPGRPESFDIIECTGVLHHMAEPLRGWRLLAGRLRPGGLMQVGLYSAISRENLRRLREADPAHPGPGCGADAARAYRRELMARGEGETGAELVASQDFYALSDFRDLALHESEYQFELPEIERFLGENRLEFAGFALPPAELEAFARRYPDDPPPGSLANWDAFERENPRLFDAMYNFWCRKADTA